VGKVNNKQEQTYVRSLSFKDAPLTALFSPEDTDRSIESLVFRDWENALGALPNFPQRWRTVRDGEDVVLEQMVKGDQTLLTGDLFWQNYTVEAEIRHMLPTSSPGPDDEYRSAGRSGIVFRGKDNRRYYFFCIEGYSKAVLYKRGDANFIPLDWTWCSISPDQYHRMKISGSEDCLTCWLDGRRIFRVFDGQFQSGRGGIRTTTLCRFKSVRFTAPPKEASAREKRIQLYNEAASEEAAEYPKPVLEKEIDLSARRSCLVRFADLRSTGRKSDVLIFSDSDADKNTADVKAVTLDGDEIWRAKIPETFLTRAADINNDGIDEIITIGVDGFIRILSGKNGNELRKTPLPAADPPYTQPRNTTLAPIFGPYVANLSGGNPPGEIVLVEDRNGEGGHTLWCYDRELKLIWKTTIDQPAYGHHIHFADINRDGRDEILAGYHLLNGDGKILLQLAGSEYFDVFQAARHADLAVMFPYPDMETGKYRAFLCAGGEGLLLYDLNDGQILARHRVGHVQDGTVGNYCPGVPGLSLWCCTRWGNPGIHVLIDGDGNLISRMEPDVVSELAGYPVNWRGDGGELYLLSGGPSSLGLWDRSGRRVVTLPDEPGSEKRTIISLSPESCAGAHSFAMDVLGDSRDELIFITRDWIKVYTQNTPPPDQQKVYAPRRNWDTALGMLPRKPFPAAAPLVSEPSWLKAWGGS
jgi:hypothetical protein